MTNITFDALVLLTSLPSETSTLWKYRNIHKQLFKNILYWIDLYTSLFLKIYYGSRYGRYGSLFLLTTDLISIIPLSKVKLFSVSTELYESILILAKIMINTICNTTFFTCKIFNPLSNFITPPRIK